MSENIKHNLDQDQEWRQYVEDSIQYFLDNGNIQHRDKLDYTVPSLDVVETWLLQRYSDLMEIYEDEDERLIVGCFFYIGEVFRRNLGGYWSGYPREFRRSDLPYATHFIEGFCEEITVLPSEDVTHAVDERTEHWFLNTYESGLTMIKSRNCG